ncbi:MAG TPA: aminotransferase class IV [Solirubrobacterales bacterium]|nr:aminotransferase class IV [Solirubrobacterales bacterium]
MAPVFDPPRPDRDQGVFETLLIIDGRPVELDAHLARLANSLAELFPDRSAPDLKDEIERLAAGVERGSIRAVVAPGGAAALRARVEPRAPVRGAFPPDSEGKAPRSVALRSLELGGGLGGHKWADRSLLEGIQAGLPKGAIPFILDQDGAVLEASRANVFVVNDGCLSTPPTDGRILPGITRMRVLEIAEATGLPVREAELTRDDLPAADEVFLTGSVRGIESVSSLDGTQLGSDREVSSRLAAELRRSWAGAQVG